MLYQQIARNKRKTAFLLVIFVIILALVGGGLGYLINGEPLSGIVIALIGSLILSFYCSSKSRKFSHEHESWPRDS